MVLAADNYSIDFQVDQQLRVALERLYLPFIGTVVDTFKAPIDKAEAFPSLPFGGEPGDPESQFHALLSHIQSYVVAFVEKGNAAFSDEDFESNAHVGYRRALEWIKKLRDKKKKTDQEKALITAFESFHADLHTYALAAIRDYSKGNFCNTDLKSIEEGATRIFKKQLDCDPLLMNTVNAAWSLSCKMMDPQHLQTQYSPLMQQLLDKQTKESWAPIIRGFTALAVGVAALSSILYFANNPMDPVGGTLALLGFPPHVQLALLIAGTASFVLIIGALVLESKYSSRINPLDGVTSSLHSLYEAQLKIEIDRVNRGVKNPEQIAITPLQAGGFFASLRAKFQSKPVDPLVSAPPSLASS